MNAARFFRFVCPRSSARVAQFVGLASNGPRPIKRDKPSNSPPWQILCGLSLMLLVSGCGPSDKIEHYTVAKPAPIETANAGGTMKPPSTRDRMIAAIVPQGEQTWFYKMSGPNAAVADQMEEFLEFLGSLTHSKDKPSKPQWKLPEGWTEQPGSQMRFATIKVPTEGESLELTVIPLPNGQIGRREYAVSNINRWRAQLGLAPISEMELFREEDPSEETREVELSDGTKVILVNLVGEMSDNAMGAAPFAGGAHPAPKNMQPAAGSPTTEQGGGLITFDAPAGWTPGKIGGMRKAGYEVRDGEQVLEITAIDLTNGDRLSNINRWREQVGLKAISAEELKSAIQPLPIDGKTGDYVQLVGPESGKRPETILGVIVDTDERVWFFKLKGDSQLAQREKPKFEAFVRSVKFR